IFLLTALSVTDSSSAARVKLRWRAADSNAISMLILGIFLYITSLSEWLADKVAAMRGVELRKNQQLTCIARAWYIRDNCRRSKVAVPRVQYDRPARTNESGSPPGSVRQSSAVENLR